jgi:hypothetical protein
MTAMTFSTPSVKRNWPLLVVLTLAAGLVLWACRDAVSSGMVGSDFLCFWAAGEIVASGRSPYDAELQARIQQEHGWDKTTLGLGIYDFLPYYYPPWAALVCAALTPLGYTAAKFVWVFLNIELTFLAGFLLRDAAAKRASCETASLRQARRLAWAGCGRLEGPKVPPAVALLVVPVFLFTVLAVLLGQPVMMLFFLLVLVWRLLDKRWDWLAGGVLVWLTHKPQLSLILILALLLWSARQRRWGVVGGFLVTLAVMSVACALVVPTWPVQMLKALETLPPTHYYPWIGTSWPLVLQTFDLSGWAFWAAYLIVALPFTGFVVWTAVRRETPLSDVLSLSLLAAFVVAPYARHYDFPFLLIPLLVLVERKLSRAAGAAVSAALVVVPYVQIVLLAHLKERFGPIFKWHGEITFLWVPVLLAVVWFLTATFPKATSAPLPPAADC